MSYATKITGIGTNWNNNIDGVEEWVAGDLGDIDIYIYLDIQSSFSASLTVIYCNQ